MIVTSNGTVYETSGTIAWPQKDPRKTNSIGLNHLNYNPTFDWGYDVAVACGLMVDASLPRDSYAVRAAGQEWLEVYESLRKKSV